MYKKLEINFHEQPDDSEKYVLTRIEDIKLYTEDSQLLSDFIYEIKEAFKAGYKLSK